MKRILGMICGLCLAVMLSAQTKVQHLTQADFLKKVMDYKANPQTWNYLGDKPCLIDFYATWCGPCKMMSPILDELAAEYAGQIYIYKIDIDEERELAEVFGISAVPTLLFCPVGDDPQVAQGAMSKEQLKTAIGYVLLNESLEK